MVFSSSSPARNKRQPNATLPAAVETYAIIIHV